MKKILSFVLALMMVLSMGITAFADVTFEFDKVQVVKGQNITVTIKNDTEIQKVTSFAYHLYFNSDLFEFVSFNGTTYGSGTVAISDVKTDETKGSYFAISYIDSQSETHTIPVGNIGVVTLKAKETVTAASDAKFTLEKDGVYGGAFVNELVGEGTIKNGDVTIKVVPSIEVSGVTLNKTTLDLDINGSETLTATVSPEDASDKSVAWSSSAEDVATVDQSGKVTAVKVGSAVITAKAGDKTATCNVTVTDPNAPKTVTVKISSQKMNINVTFYTDKEATTKLDSSLVVDKGVQSNYHIYEITVPNGTYYYRATDGETNLGGMGFTVTKDTTIVNLRRVNFQGAKNYFAPNAGDFTVSVVCSNGLDVVLGTQYTDASKGAVTPALLVAKNSSSDADPKYTPTYVLNETTTEGYVILAKSSNPANFANNTVAQTVYFYADPAPSRITAPKGATIEIFKQVKNFNVEKVEATEKIDNGDGTITYTVAAPTASYTYRVSMEGKLTHAGYFQSGVYEHIVVDFKDDPAPTTTTGTVTANLGEASTMLNVNGQNNLQLGVGETFRLRSYRAAWQIVNTVTGNIMIEPDYNYTIISGGEHIEMTPATDRCTGNAGSGNSSNWMDIEGVSNGIAIIEVSYDAIKIGGKGTTMTGIYGATDPNRTSLVVIEVGAAGNSAAITAEGSINVWDTEYDTVYFTGASGVFAFTAKVGEKSATKAELSTDKGKTWTVIPVADGKFTATGLVSGNNIIRFTADGETAYQVVRAAKVSYTVKNLTREESSEIFVGDQIEIRFNGLYMPIPKFSGIYNPGYGKLKPGSTWQTVPGSQGHKILYTTMPEGTTYAATGGQYTFIADNKITITIAQSGDNVFKGGYIDFSVMGTNNILGGHRTLTNEGVPANMNAVSTDHTRAVMPDITVKVSTGVTLDKTTLSLKCNNDPETLKATLSEDITDKTLEWKSSDEKVVTVDQSGKVTVVGIGSATITVKTVTTAEGETSYSAECAVTVAHNWDDGKVETAPTCSAVGKKVYTCKNNCTNNTREEEIAIDANAHGWEEEIEYNWSADGKTCTAVRKCKHNSQHNITATGKVTSEVAVPATCSSKGDTRYEATFTETWAKTAYTSRTDIEIDPDAHSYGAWHITKQPTYTENGTMQRECGLCGKEEIKIIPKKVYDEDKPNPGVTDIVPKEDEKNPNTGAPVFDLTAAGIVVLAAAVAVVEEKRRK